MAGYVGNIPVPQGTQTRQSFTATASQTSFPTIGFTPGFCDVYLNGIKLLRNVDFDDSNGSDILLTTGAAVNDVLNVVIFDTFDTSSGNFNNSTFTSSTLKSNVTLKNDTEQDTDGGRASKIIYQGEQSGGEISTLAEIEASHDGTADDEKGDLIFRTNDGSDGTSPTEAMRITSAQKIGVGTSNPLGEVTIAKDAGGNAPTSVTAANTYLQLGSDDFGPSSNGKFMIGFGYTDATNTNSPAYIGFEETSNSGDTKGALTFYTRDVVTDTAPTERMRILPAGGITFNGDTATDNALDDYEQGTFTAAVKGNTTNPTTATNMSGTYTKIGNFVNLHMLLNAGNLSGASGYIYFEHMPFSCTNIALGNIMHYNTLTYSNSSHTDIVTRLSGTTMSVYGSGSNQNWGVVNHNGSTNAYIDISISYRTS